MQCPGREFHGRWAESPQPWTMKGWMWVSTVQEGEVNGLSQKWPLGAYVTWLYCGGKKPNIYSAQIEGTDKWKKKSIRGPPVKPPPLPPSSPFSSHLLLLTHLPLTSSSFRLLLLLTFLLYPLSLSPFSITSHRTGGEMLPGPSSPLFSSVLLTFWLLLPVNEVWGPRKENPVTHRL